MMTTTELMKRHGIRSVVFVPKDDLLPEDCFHAWPFNEPIDVFGRGDSVETAIFDLVAKQTRKAA